MDIKTGKILTFEPGAAEKELRAALRNEMIGQEEAIERAVRVIMDACAADGKFRNPVKPAGVFFLLGPTGVGKTYLVKVLAQIFFGSQEALTRIDCSEFQEKHEISRLIGAPAGYLGHDQEPYLSQWNVDKWGHAAYMATSKGHKAMRLAQASLEKADEVISVTEDKVTELEEAIRDGSERLDEKSPDYEKKNKALERLIQEKEQLSRQLAVLKKEKDTFSNLYGQLLAKHGYRPGAYPSIILFDEIEKAHPALFTLMLQILDEARVSIHSKLKDDHGNKILEPVTLFHNSLIFLTSNLAQAEIVKTLKGNASIGFGAAAEVSHEITRKTIREMVIERLEDTRFSRLPQEFLGRIGKENIIVFDNLTRAQIREGLDRLLIPRLINRFNAALPIILNISEEARERLVDMAYEKDNRVFGMRAMESIFVKHIQESLALLATKTEEEGGIIAGDIVTIDVSETSAEKNFVFYLADRLSAQAKAKLLPAPSGDASGHRIIRPFRILKKK